MTGTNFRISSSSESAVCARVCVRVWVCGCSRTIEELLLLWLLLKAIELCERSSVSVCAEFRWFRHRFGNLTRTHIHTHTHMHEHTERERKDHHNHIKHRKPVACALCVRHRRRIWPPSPPCAQCMFICYVMKTIYWKRICVCVCELFVCMLARPFVWVCVCMSFFISYLFCLNTFYSPHSMRARARFDTFDLMPIQSVGRLPAFRAIAYVFSIGCNTQTIILTRL